MPGKALSTALLAVDLSQEQLPHYHEKNLQDLRALLADERLHPLDRQIVMQGVKRREMGAMVPVSLTDPWATVNLLRQVLAADEETLVELYAEQLHDLEKLRAEVKLIVVEASLRGRITQQQGFSLLQNFGLTGA